MFELFEIYVLNVSNLYCNILKKNIELNCV